MTDAYPPAQPAPLPPVTRRLFRLLAIAGRWVWVAVRGSGRFVLYWVRTLLLASLVTLDYLLRGLMGGLIFLVTRLPGGKKRPPPDAPATGVDPGGVPAEPDRAFNRPPALARLRARLEAIERRAAEAEDLATKREFDWEQRLRR